MNPIEHFKNEVTENINELGKDKEYSDLTRQWYIKSCDNKYHYSSSWLGRPIIQMPTDIVLMQEIIWNLKPDLIIETGIAHGGSILFAASILEMINLYYPENNGLIVGIDIDIREHNKKEIESSPLMKRIKMFEGSSIHKDIVSSVNEVAKGKNNILLQLDSHHSYDHVIEEMKLYSDLVSVGSYMIVWDTVIETLPERFSNDRPWGKGNSPMTAVDAFLKNNDNFVLDEFLCSKAVATSAERGFLKRIK